MCNKGQKDAVFLIEVEAKKASLSSPQPCGWYVVVLSTGYYVKSCRFSARRLSTPPSAALSSPTSLPPPKYVLDLAEIHVWLVKHPTFFSFDPKLGMGQYGSHPGFWQLTQDWSISGIVQLDHLCGCINSIDS